MSPTSAAGGGADGAPPDLLDGPLHLRDKACWDVDLIVDGRWWARIDVHIGTEIHATAYRACDLYFKRYIDRRSIRSDSSGRPSAPSSRPQLFSSVPARSVSWRPRATS